MMPANIGVPKPGTWSFWSESDPRWTGAGRSENIVVFGGLPEEMSRKLDELKGLYGDPPKDLEYELIKD